MNARTANAVTCYVLLVAAWIIDLLTPQLFVAAVLMNGPIALSTLALQPSLTIQLTVFAEIANVIAGYVNGVQAGSHWDAIAIGDRLLSALSFLLVGALTIRAQETARRAGEATERERLVASERALRHAMESVRASLNMELVLRNAAREGQKLLHPDRTAIITRESSLQVPDWYEIGEGESDVQVTRKTLEPHLSSIIERARASERVVTVDPNDPLGRLFGEAALVAVCKTGGADTIFLATWKSGTVPPIETRLQAQAFVDNLSVALGQAHLFVQLAERNDEVARQKDELQARNDVIRDIVYALAHDLRTPLTAANVTMTQALAGAYGELPEKYREILKTSLSSNLDLRRLVETLLLVARYESGEDSHAYTDESISELTERVVTEFRAVAEAKPVSLAFTSDNTADVASVDGTEVRRAIANLVANAVEATPVGGHVDVRVEHNGKKATVSVVDDGYGVPPDRRALLFQRFSGLRSGGGTGLGLYIVRRIAEKYGGHAGYEPCEPRGSRFFIELPLEGSAT